MTTIVKLTELQLFVLGGWSCTFLLALLLS